MNQLVDLLHDKNIIKRLSKLSLDQMKILLLSFILLPGILPAQVLIHSHNDYEKPAPLVNALYNRVFSIEADVYLVNDSLRVAHEKEESASAPTLNTLYLRPIIELFRQHKGHISDDAHYSPILMIDIKENSKDVVKKLVKEVSRYPRVFDRTINPAAMRVVISGDRGPVAEWTSYPAFIFFDGRPSEKYEGAVLKKIAFISDSYNNYSNAADSTGNGLRQLVQKVHGMKKLLRLWATPDDSASWDRFHQLGVDIINTDQVDECRKYFSGVRR